MPNWIEGTIKLRGCSEDLKRFFSEGIEPILCVYNKDKTQKEKSVECNFGEYNTVYIRDEVHVRETRRAVIQECNVEWSEAYATVAMPIKQAWAFIACEEDSQKWKEISKKFKLDIRIFGFECGMEFCEEVEIIKGEVTMDDEIKYSDWMWECPFPLMGG